MKTDKQNWDALFGQIRLETPSAEFTEKLNLRLEKEMRRREWRQRCLPVVQLAAGIAAMLMLPAVVLYFLPGFDFPTFKLDIEINPMVWTAGLAVLLLLLGDMLVRRRLGMR